MTSNTAAIPIIEMGLRSSTSTATKYSPFELVNGYKFPLPIIQNSTSALKFTGDYKDYLDTVIEKLTALQAAALDNLQKTRDTNVLQYNKRNNSQYVEWKVGDRVLLSSHRVTDPNKVLTKDKYEPGFIVTQVVKGPNMGVAYQLTRLDGRVLKTLISHDRLKLDTSVNREKFDARNPALVAQNPISDATIGSMNANAHTHVDQHSLNVNDDSNDNVIPMSPALKVLREKGTGARKQYYVLFETGERAWADQISPALLKAWLIVKAARTARRRRRKRS